MGAEQHFSTSILVTLATTLPGGAKPQTCLSPVSKQYFSLEGISERNRESKSFFAALFSIWLVVCANARPRVVAAGGNVLTR